jgi:hypothetical protein
MPDLLRHRGVLSVNNRLIPLLDSPGSDHLTIPRGQPERFVDATKAAEYLCCSRKHLLKLSVHGKIPAHPLPGSGKRRTWRYLLSELRDWMLSNSRGAKADGSRKIGNGGSRKGDQ